jgi:HD-like signal output (HDOD) protein
MNDTDEARTEGLYEEEMSIKDKLVDMIHNHPDLPTLGSSIAQVVQLTSSDDQSRQQLTNLILSDPSLTLKILRLVNSMTYRATTQTITSISVAIQLLGMDTVKTSALAMILVDKMPRQHANAVRIELMISLSASLIGRNLAKRSSFPNAEEVAVAALFKNLGRFILAVYDNELYRVTMKLAMEKDYTESKASLEILGCSFSWLTDYALRAWHIPESIIQAMKLMPGRVLKSPKNRGEWMQQVTEFSNSAALMTLKDTESRANSKIEDLLGRFGGALSIDTVKLQNIVNESAEQLHGISAYTREMEEHTDKYFDQPVVVPDKKNELIAVTDDTDLWINQTESCSNNRKPVNAAEMLLAGVQEVRKLLTSKQYTVNTLLMLVLEIYYRSLGFQFVTVCVKDVRTNQFRARNSVGFNHQDIQKNFVFLDSAASDLFSITMQRNVDLEISDATEPKIRNALPIWHRRLLPDTKSFMILPLVLQNKPIGLIYADRPVIAQENITVEEMKLIKALKANVLVACNV